MVFALSRLGRRGLADSAAFARNPVDVLHNLINGQLVASTSQDFLPVINPATNEVVGLVPDSTTAELEAAVASSQAALPAWRETSVSNRCRVMLNYQALLRANESELMEAIVLENGKTAADAKGDIFRGLEVVEQCCALGPALMGETLGGVASGLDTYSYKQPLGVVAGIAPFNFPAMIPLWMFPVAVTCGNTFLLKPSEKVPTTAMVLARLATEAGLPDGVLNVVHGSKRAVDFICDSPPIRAISFVGGNVAGEYIHARGTANGKRVQANLGAKNHAVIMPDADKDSTIDALLNASMGAAGQRCMALSVAVLVGESAKWVPEIADRARRLSVGAGCDAATDVGPMITRASLERVEQLIESAVAGGATLALDGRAPALPSHLAAGNFLGPTILDDVTVDSDAYTHELFAPVLSCVKCASLEEAIALVNANPFGNGTAIFTASGSAARQFQHEVDVGQVGINTPIPVPLPMFSFTGSRGSIRGDLHFYGKQGVQFFTQTKTITSNWKTPAPRAARPTTAMPTMK